MKAKLNKLIKQFIEDDRYLIRPDGTIFNTKKGKTVGFKKKTELKMRNKQYMYVKYKGKEIKVHRIVYAKFIGDLEHGLVVHHIDSDGLNNAVDNLEQVSQELNSSFRKEG